MLNLDISIIRLLEKLHAFLTASSTTDELSAQVSQGTASSLEACLELSQQLLLQF